MNYKTWLAAVSFKNWLEKLETLYTRMRLQVYKADYNPMQDYNN